MALKIVVAIVMFSLLSFQLQSIVLSQPNWIKAAYWTVESGYPISLINSTLFNHLICSSSFVNSSTYQASIFSSFESYFANFTRIVKRRNPSIKTLYDIRHDTETNTTCQCDALSSMINEPFYRNSLINSSINLARRYGFDGIHFSWMWPNSTEMDNLGVLLDEWRDAIISESRNSNKSQLLLTMWVAYISNKQVGIYPIDSMTRNLDWADAPTAMNNPQYSWYVTASTAPLYDPLNHLRCIDFGTREWLTSGFPANKLVMCLAFYGCAWKLKNPNESDVGSPALGAAMTTNGVLIYSEIKSVIQSYGYGAASVYNATYAVNLFTNGSIWISFDGVEAIRAKVSYAKGLKLLGYSAWQISNDDNWELSQAAALAAQEEVNDPENKPNNPEETNENRQRLLLIVLPVASIIIMIACTMCFFRSKIFLLKGLINLGHRKTPNLENLGSDCPELQVFSFTSIKEATNDFSRANKLGQGGFGSVYKGELPGGKEIAVKRLSTSSDQGVEQFKNEVSLTARLQHVNLVRVLGFCTENEEMILVYEYMPNKSLDFHLFAPVKRLILDWKTRVRIIEGVTQGLLYLQEYSNFTIIHRDIKASNILLDYNMNPKISDFGMAKLFKKDAYETNTSRIVGTYGYIPPEYVREGIYTLKHDVYSFGVLLLQMLSGKKNACCYGPNENLSLLDYAYELWIEGRMRAFVDPSLDDSSCACKVARCIEVALLCVQQEPVDRPTMLDVSSMLKHDSMPIATPKRPAYTVKSDCDGDGGALGQSKHSYNNSAQFSDLEPR